MVHTAQGSCKITRKVKSLSAHWRNQVMPFEAVARLQCCSAVSVYLYIKQILRFGQRWVFSTYIYKLLTSTIYPTNVGLMLVQR